MKEFLNWWDLDIEKHILHDTHLNVAFDAWKAALGWIRKDIENAGWSYDTGTDYDNGVVAITHEFMETIDKELGEQK